MWKYESLKVFWPLLFALASSHATNQKNATEGNFDAGCSRIFTDEQVVFESPGYPSGYPANFVCSYLFKGPVCPTYFNFQFLDFNLVSSLGCTKDRLEIHDQDALCGSRSGTKTYFAANGALETRFISDGQSSGRGFKILVTRLPCDAKPETTTPDPGIAWETNPHTVVPKNAPPYLSTLQTPLQTSQAPKAPTGSTLPFCCANSYNSRRFFLSSPGFPYSNNNPGECVYHIHRASPIVCRLRIHFLFFWSGEQDVNLGCSRGFLEVDGKIICGCRIGLKLISAFDSRWGSAPKVLRFKNSGFPRSAFSGFALEVIQDECPKRLVPTEGSVRNALGQPQFHFYNDQINRLAWPKNTNNNQEVVERALLVRENTEILDDDYGNRTKSGVVKHFYFFEAPDDYDAGYDVRTGRKTPREIEETTYLDTSGIKSLLPDGYDNYKCRAWGGLQWAMLAQEVLWQQMPKCNDFVTKPISRQCEYANYVRGYVQSPGFPHYYPGNLNLCYRFGRHPGYCAIRLTFVDFHLEDSFQCRKDYLALGGRYRYCGQSLHKAVLTFDLSNNPYEEMYFVTDSYSCGRGFKGVYEQIPCDNIGVPVNPPNPVYPTRPTTPSPPPLTPSAPPPLQPCSRDIQDNVFVIEVYSNHQPRCAFNIFKRNPNVCRLSLTFHHFDLPCETEHLLINNRRYCGRISGQTLNVNFNYYQLQLIYERSVANLPITGLRFRISGEQLSTGCDPYEYPTVPAERSVLLSKNADKQLQNLSDVGNTDAFAERKYDKGICGVILNATEDAIATSVCEFLTQRDNSTECVQITAKTIYVPYNSANSRFYNGLVNELDLTDFDRLEKVDVSEISCDEASKIKRSN